MTLLYCVSVLFFGGLVKGVLGLGLPLVGVPLIALAVGLKEALAILALPVMASNLAQSFNKELFRPIVRRFWPLLVATLLFATLSTIAFGAIPEQTLFLAIGSLLIVLPTVAYFQPSVRITSRQETWIGPLVGAAAGVFGGVSSMPGPPLMIYLACLRLPKNEFVVAVSLMFLTATIGLAIGLAIFGGIPLTNFGLSALACIPVFVGMWLGVKARLQLSERTFAVLVLFTYILTGLSFVVKGIW
jgi:uncharacterized membrane protein YfcA